MCSRLDNGPELVSQTLAQWAADNGVELMFTQPGKPTQNAYIERFNRSYRTEVLDCYVFESLLEVRQLIEDWMHRYNHERPHESLGRIPPVAYRMQQYPNYRHEDSYSETGHLYRALTRHFGEDSVFLDQSGIQSGEDFPEKLREAVDAAEVFLMVIGPGWLEAFSRREASPPVDYVREEIVRALNRRKKEGDTKLRIIPVLVHQAKLPDNKDDLPEAIRGIAVLNTHLLRDGVADYEYDFQTLCILIDSQCGNLLSRRQNTWLMRSLTDRKQSKADIGPDISILANPTQLIPRSGVQTALENWWATWQEQRWPFVLLGDEGDGKSWAVSTWLAGKIQNGLGVPVVYTSASGATHTDIEIVLAGALDKSLPTFSDEGWTRILGRFCENEGAPNPRFLLVLDGLNERPSEDWGRFLQQCLASPWRECLAVIVICRSAYWNRRLEAFNDEVEHATLPPYDEDELRDALRRAGHKPDDFYPDVLKVMRKPRSLKLALRLYAEVEQGGATLERLLLEDWRDMTRHRASGNPMTHKEFLAWIRDLVSLYGDSLDHADLAARASGYGDPRELKEEMLNADILREEDDGSFKVQEKPLLLGLGLLLAHEVKSFAEQGEAAMEEQIDRRMGEQPDMDLRVRICGMALLYALSIGNFPEAGLLALLRAWVGGRNFDSDDLTEVTAYLPLHPEIYLRMAEEVWGKIDNREAQDVFMAGFLCYRTQPMVREKLVEAFTRWLGFVYLNGYRGYFEREPDKLTESRQEVESLLGETPVSSAVMDRFDYELVVTNNQGLMRLGQVAVAVISHEADRRPYGRALITGMLANAAMGGGWPEFYWVCRTADMQTQGELMQAAQSLIEQQQPLAYAAARVTLSALGSDAARNIREIIPNKFRPEHPSTQYVREHRCEVQYWQADNYLDCLQAQQWPSAKIVKQLQELAAQPEIVLPDSVVAQLQEVGVGLDLANVAAGMGNTAENLFIEEIEPALCAYLPERYAKLMRSLAAELSKRDGLSRRMLAWHLYEHLPVLDTTTRQTIDAAWQATQAGEGEEDRWAELMLFPLVVFDQPAEDQLQYTLRRAIKRGHIVGNEPCFRPFAPEDLPRIEQALAKVAPERLPDVLYQLARSLPQLDTDLRNRLLVIFQAGDTYIRGLCLEIFFHAQDERATRAVIEGGWQAPSMKEERLEADYGSLLLGRYGVFLSFDELAQRIDLEWLGYALEMRGYQPHEVVTYSSLLNGIWQRLAGIEISPEIGGRIVTVKVERDSEAILDRIDVRPHESGDIRLTNYTWGGNAGAGSLEWFKLSMDQDAMLQEQTQASRAVLDKIEAMRDAGNSWYVFSFQHGHLDKVVTLPGAHWRDWLAAATEIGGERIIALCRAFYEKLCAALLDHEPESGASLFRALRSRSTIRLTYAETRLPILLCDLFSAKNSVPVDELRNAILEDCTTDLALFEVVLLSRRGGAGVWLSRKIATLRDSNRDYDRARAWMLEGYSLSSEGYERLQEFVASGENSWVRDTAEIALRNRKRDSWTRHWFERFLAEADRVKAWAAFRLFLRCVDRRFWLWLPEMSLNDAEPWKRDAYQANRAEIFKATEKNEKEWQDTLVGHKVKPNELWPWMKDYAVEM